MFFSTVLKQVNSLKTGIHVVLNPNIKPYVTTVNYERIKYIVAASSLVNLGFIHVQFSSVNHFLSPKGGRVNILPCLVLLLEFGEHLSFTIMVLVFCSTRADLETEIPSTPL